MKFKLFRSEIFKPETFRKILFPDGKKMRTRDALSDPRKREMVMEAIGENFIECGASTVILALFLVSGCDRLQEFEEQERHLDAWLHSA